MSTPLESDTELRHALQTVVLAESLYRRVLAETIDATRIAAALVTDEELQRWATAAEKLWTAQTALSQRHGFGRDTIDADRQVIRVQAHRAWLGNLTGVVAPLLIFGLEPLTHSFVLPLYWATAVVADIAGRMACLRRARLNRSHVTIAPTSAWLSSKETISAARNSHNWNIALAETQLIDRVDAAIDKTDIALKNARRFGQKIGATALIILFSALTATYTNTVSKDVASWVLLVVGLAVIFGLACWLTSLSYAGTIEQPPYPVHGSAQRFKRHIHFESLLAGVPNSSFNGLESIHSYTTEQMRKKRVLHKPLRELQRAGHHLEDSRWKVAMLEAERTSK